MTGGIFIAFEGVEGSGKSTQIDKLADLLHDLGHTVTVTREPGSGWLGERLRALLLESAPGSIPPSAEALLFAADRAYHVETIIQPALARGDIVLCDRFVDSSIAYQGYGRKLGHKQMAWLSGWATGHLSPTLTVVLDLDPKIGLGRVSGRGGQDRIEKESLEFHRVVRGAYLTCAKTSPARYLVVDANQQEHKIAGEIARRVVEMIPGGSAGHPSRMSGLAGQEGKA